MVLWRLAHKGVSGSCFLEGQSYFLCLMPTAQNAAAESSSLSADASRMQIRLSTGETPVFSRTI